MMQLPPAEEVGVGLGDGDGDGEAAGDESPGEGGEMDGIVPDGSGIGRVIALLVGAGEELVTGPGPVSPPGDPGPRVRGSWAAAAEPGCPCSRADGKAVMPGRIAAIAFGCGRMVTDTNENSRKIMAPDTRTIIGGSSSIGCARSATAPLRTVVLTLSAATASAMSRGAMLGPWPSRPLLRTLVSAACRCAAVRPGRR